MGKGIDYSAYFSDALQIIRSIRDPHASRPDNADLKWNVVKEQVLFDYGGADFQKYSSSIYRAQEISVSCVQSIILKMLEINGYSNTMLEVPKTGLLRTTRFAIKETKTQTLLLFKEIEESSFWKVKNREPDEVVNILKTEKLTSCQYIYFVFDYAYLQVINHNKDELDPGRGYNIFSIKWFFETYFGSSEANLFMEALQDYILKVNNYLGYILLKSLTPSTLVNFRKLVEAEILGYAYDELPEKKIIKNRTYELTHEGYELICNQFFGAKTYLLLLGTCNFAESLLTAEWLYDSMKKAQAIDLTVIGTGYFKAAEQLLYGLICLHRNEGRLIQRAPSRKDLLPQIELTEDSIKEKSIDSTIGAMANFYKDNTDILRSELPKWAKTYIKEAVFNYKDLRNKYTHKENIHEWDVIDSIRNATFELAFLLIGAHTFTKEQLCELGMPDISYFDDYSRLCEYINYHSEELFYVTSSDNKENLYVGCSDNNAKLVNDSYIQYSGAFFRDFNPNGKRYVLLKDHLPKRITLAKLVFEQGVEKVAFSPVKVKVIFENGRFIGPPIATEERIRY